MRNLYRSEFRIEFNNKTIKRGVVYSFAIPEYNIRPDLYWHGGKHLVQTGLIEDDTGLPVYIFRPDISDFGLDATDYTGTGGGPQAIQWAMNKRKIVDKIKEHYPEKKFVATIWSGQDFNDVKTVKW